MIVGEADSFPIGFTLVSSVGAPYITCMVRFPLMVSLLFIAAGCATGPQPAESIMGGCNLVYHPMPGYPVLVRRAYLPIVGWGTYSVSFDASGNATAAKTIRSARSDALDDAATSTLRTWKSQPGRPCTAWVRIKFDPESPGGF